MVKAGGPVQAFPKMSLFSTACQVVAFSRQIACFGILKVGGGGGWGILGKMIQKFLRTSQNMFFSQTCWVFFPVLRCWAMKPAAPPAGLAPVHGEQVGPWGHQRPGWHKGCVPTAPGAREALQNSDDAAGGPGVGLEEGSGLWSWAACLGDHRSCPPAFLGFSSQLSPHLL